MSNRTITYTIIGIVVVIAAYIIYNKLKPGIPPPPMTDLSMAALGLGNTSLDSPNTTDAITSLPLSGSSLLMTPPSVGTTNNGQLGL